MRRHCIYFTKKGYLRDKLLNTKFHTSAQKYPIKA